MPQPLTTVIHIRDMKLGDVRVDRKTIFGNPFRIRQMGSARPTTREQVIKAHKGYFYRRINIDPEFKAAVLQLKGKRLGCWCAPKPCHGNVIAAWLNREKEAKDEKQPTFCDKCGAELAATNTTSGLPSCPVCFTSAAMTKEEGEIPERLECEYSCGSTATKVGDYWDVILSKNSGWSGCWQSGKVRGNPPFINVRKASFYCGCRGWE